MCRSIFQISKVKTKYVNGLISFLSCFHFDFYSLPLLLRNNKEPWLTHCKCTTSYISKKKKNNYYLFSNEFANFWTKCIKSGDLHNLQEVKLVKDSFFSHNYNKVKLLTVNVKEHFNILIVLFFKLAIFKIFYSTDHINTISRYRQQHLTASFIKSFILLKHSIVFLSLMKKIAPNTSIWQRGDLMN